MLQTVWESGALQTLRAGCEPGSPQLGQDLVLNLLSHVTSAGLYQLCWEDGGPMGDGFPAVDPGRVPLALGAALQEAILPTRAEPSHSLLLFWSPSNSFSWRRIGHPA